jgi:hypothetical protein
MTRGGFIEYPGGLDKISQELRTQLEDDFDSQDAKTREAILAEILGAYSVYYAAVNYKPSALSDARIRCDRMINSANKTLDSIKSMNDPITPHYDNWMYLNNVQGSLKTALKNHVSALKWARWELAKRGVQSPFLWQALRENSESFDLYREIEKSKAKEKQLATEKPVKPKRQRKPAAREQFIDTLEAIYKRHNPPSETIDVDDLMGAFIEDTLEALDL